MLKYEKRKRTFWDDELIGPKLDAIPEHEMSVIIRIALRDWFGLANNGFKKGVISNDGHTQNRKDHP